MKSEKHGEITISESDFQQWQKEAQELQQKIGGLMQQMATLHKKMEAYQLLRAESDQANNQMVNVATTPVSPPLSKVIKMASALPDHIMAVFNPGESKTNAQIKAALRQRGIEKLGTNDAYYYTSISRLVKKGALLKEGDTYRKAA